MDTFPNARIWAPPIADLRPPRFVPFYDHRHLNNPKYKLRYRWASYDHMCWPRIYLNSFVWALDGSSSKPGIGRVIKIEDKQDIPGRSRRVYTVMLQIADERTGFSDSHSQEYDNLQLAPIEIINQEFAYVAITAVLA